MFSLEHYLALGAIGTFVCAVGFGFLAAVYVDPEKKKGAAWYIRLHAWGPGVSESILTERGKKFATLRSVSLLCFVVVLVASGITMGILQNE